MRTVYLFVVFVIAGCGGGSAPSMVNGTAGC
jgi:hypothetical protein